MASLRFRPAARQDMRRIWEFSVERWGETRADRYLDDLEAATERILTFPNSGRTLSGYRHVVRTVRVGQHMLVYRVEGDAIEIVRILHAHMDMDQHLALDK